MLEPADEIETGKDVGVGYRLFVLTTHEDLSQESPHAAREAVLTGGQGLERLENAQAAPREGRATGEAYTGQAVRDVKRLRFTSADGHQTPRTMIVFTTAALASIERTQDDRGARVTGRTGAHMRPSPRRSRCTRTTARTEGPGTSKWTGYRPHRPR